MEMRNKTGEMYKKSTLQTFRHGIQRYLEKTNPTINIVTGEQFKKSIKSFKSMTKELKRQGLAVVEHHPPISDSDLERAYAYLCHGDFGDVQRLQYKVFLDIMLHFGRRGRENLASLTREDFAVMKDGSNFLYIYQTRDEKTKNHQDDSERSSNGRMYEIQDNIRCPVRSFVKYIRLLNPLCLKLFQQAKKIPHDGVYFNNVGISHNRLGNFMSEISKHAGLSIIYSNHSSRSTTVHVLDAAQVPSRHTMSVTGHRSETSLRTYTGKTDDNTKKIMSAVISEKTKDKSQTYGVQLRENDESLTNINLDSLEPLSSSQNDALLDELQMNDGFDDILRNIEISNQSTSSTCVKNTLPMPVMYNCQNVTINYNILQK